MFTFANNLKSESQLCQLFATPWTVTFQAPLSKEFSDKNTGWVAVRFIRLSSGSSQTQVSTLQVESLVPELPGKPKNGRVAYPLLQGSS